MEISKRDSSHGSSSPVFPARSKACRKSISGNAGSKWNRHGISDGVCDYHHHHHHHHHHHQSINHHQSIIIIIIIIKWWWSSSHDDGHHHDSHSSCKMTIDNIIFSSPKNMFFLMVGPRSPEITSSKSRHLNEQKQLRSGSVKPLDISSCHYQASQNINLWYHYF